MMSLSIAIMAHQKREAMALELAQRAEISPDMVVWDRMNNIWDTARRAWLAYDPGAEHHLVLQDDAIICRDVLPGVDRALQYMPRDAAASLYIGTRRPQVNEINQAVARAEAAEVSWIAMRALCWGVAIVLPTRIITDMITWCDQQQARGDDIRIRRYLQTKMRWPVWHPWPSLVDHRDDGSLINHGGGRHAHRFIGEEASALDADWSRGCIDVTFTRRPRTIETSIRSTSAGSAHGL